MARIEATTHIEAPPAAVWIELVDWEAQPRWMHDARSVAVRTDRREGTGVVLRCMTAVAGLTVTDDMEVTDWVEERRLGVRHLGRLIRGVGVFELEPTPAGTHLTWWEEIDAPFGAAGEALASLVAVPLVRRTFRISLAQLKAVCESTSVRP